MLQSEVLELLVEAGRLNTDRGMTHPRIVEITQQLSHEIEVKFRRGMMPDGAAVYLQIRLTNVIETAHHACPQAIPLLFPMVVMWCSWDFGLREITPDFEMFNEYLANVGFLDPV